MKVKVKVSTAKEFKSAEEPPRYGRVGKVAKLMDCGTSTVWHYAKNDPEFPCPLKVGQRLTLFDLQKVVDFINRKNGGSK